MTTDDELARVAREAAREPDDEMSFEYEIWKYAPAEMWRRIATAVRDAVIDAPAREAIEARDLVDLDALKQAIEQQAQAIIQIASHYVGVAQHPVAPHIHAYLFAAHDNLHSAGQMLSKARLWIPPDDEDAPVDPQDAP